MSVNKTINALREERSMLYAEIRRLQAVAGESPSNADMVRDLRLGVDVFETPKHVIADMERAAQALTGFQVPTHMLFGHESEESMRAHMAGLGIDAEHPAIALEQHEAMMRTLERQYPDMVRGAIPATAGQPVMFTLMRAKEQLRGLINIREDVSLHQVYGTLSDALRPLAGDEQPPLSDVAYEAEKNWQSPFVDTQGPAVVVESTAAPEEVWSVNGDDGSWDYPSLAALLRDNYGSPDDGTSFGPFLGNGLKVGDTVQRAIVCKDDPAGFLQDADEVQEWMSERAYDSDASEWADNYPELDEEAEAALEKALEPLKAWARKHCQPDFFTVKDITPHTVTEADVRAAQ
ncbi:hypothetical protein [Stutzerimonas nitrititolerans]|uniref:hypothetical protein n=1 Tax=Stutzerimonas nitrititolerans TaxID=2482751 RepID=UPI0028B13029|nr:hypothetical protein [Stutzerimonas nitrititolerans]